MALLSSLIGFYTSEEDEHCIKVSHVHLAMYSYCLCNLIEFSCIWR